MPVTGPLQDPKTGRMLRYSTAAERDTHGLKSTSIEYLGEEFRIDVTPDVTPRQLADTLEVYAEMALDVQEYISGTADIKNLGAEGAYSNVVRALEKTRAQILGGSIRPFVGGRLKDVDAGRLREALCKSLSFNLTKLNRVGDYMKRKGAFNRKTGLIAKWAEKELPDVLIATNNIIRDLVALHFYENRKDKPASDMHEVIDGLIKRDSGYSTDEEGISTLPGMEPVEDWVLPGDSLPEG